MNAAEDRLPEVILNKAVSAGEYGWRQEDFISVIEAARNVPMAIIGGQIQYILPNGTFELYWLNYDPMERGSNEIWIDYCNRTADECVKKFNALISSVDIDKEARTSFVLLEEKAKSGGGINDYRVFIIYFDDKETELFVSN